MTSLSPSIGTGDSWAQVEDLSGEERGAGGEHCSPTPSGGIYSDLPEFPTEALPSPSTPETILVSVCLGESECLRVCLADCVRVSVNVCLKRFCY